MRKLLSRLDYRTGPALLAISIVLTIGGWNGLDRRREAARLEEPISKAEAERSRHDKVLTEIAAFERTRDRMAALVNLSNHLAENRPVTAIFLAEILPAGGSGITLTRVSADRSSLHIEGRSIDRDRFDQWAGRVRANEALASECPEPILRTHASAVSFAWMVKLSDDPRRALPDDQRLGR